MRFLVGVMFAGENEYQQCLAAIWGQTHSDWELFQIENQPNAAAHQQLYQTFMARAASCDAFIKIDADMVLARPSVLSDIETYLTQHEAVDMVTWPLADFYTGEMIYGLNVYRSGIPFTSGSASRPDMVHEQFQNHVLIPFDHALSPVAEHSPNPSDFQAFHFGCHKAAKVVSDAHFGHLQKIKHVYRCYQNNRDPRHKLAFLGALMALYHRIQPAQIGYQSPVIQQWFSQAIRLSPRQKSVMMWLGVWYLKYITLTTKIKVRLNG